MVLCGVVKTAQWIRGHTVLAEDYSSVFSTPVRQLTTTITAAPGGPRASGLMGLALKRTYLHRHIMEKENK